jgi:phosphomannomutase
VQEEILKNGGIPRRERVGHAYMKNPPRQTAIFGGEAQRSLYTATNFYADSE